MATVNESEKQQGKNGVSVKVSQLTHNKTVQLERLMKYSTANNAWGKDQKMLRCNILQVPTSKNYMVLLAMGKNSR